MINFIKDMDRVKIENKLVHNYAINMSTCFLGDKGARLMEVSNRAFAIGRHKVTGYYCALLSKALSHAAHHHSLSLSLKVYTYIHGTDIADLPLSRQIIEIS